MRLTSGSTGIGMYASIIEPEINREASEYIQANYYDLIGWISKKLEIKDDKKYDLLNDVFISVVNSEDDGEGFDMEYGEKMGRSDEDSPNIISCEQFIKGRLKLYAKNNKYRTDIVEHGNSYVYRSDVYYETEVDKNGQVVLGKDGKPKLVRHVNKKKVGVTITSHAASFNQGGDVESNNDDFQKAYAMAAVADSTDDTVEILSLREQIDYCIDVCELHGVHILNMFKNLDMLADLLGEYSKKRKKAESVFSKITELAEYHDEFGETLISILNYSAKNRAAFDLVMATY